MSTLKERLENHIVVIAFGFSISVGVAVYGVVNFFHRQELKQIQAKQEITQSRQIARLASIERDMPDQKFFDIRQLILSPQQDSNVPEQSTYVTSDLFYAPLESNYWNYRKTTENGLIQLISDGAIPDALEQAGAVIPIHLWTGRYEATVESDGDTWKAFPFIVVQRFPYHSITDILNISVSSEQNDSEPAGVRKTIPDNDSYEVEKRLGNLSNLMRDDFTGIMFHLQTTLSIQQAIQSPNQSYRLLKVQKVGNVLYSQSLTEHHQPLVNGAKVNALYHRQELILISTKTDLFIVKISVPALEPIPRGQVYAEINSWLAGFRVVLNP